MYVMITGKTMEASARLQGKGWRPMAIEVGGKARINAVEKAGFVVAFDPDGGYASEPHVQTPLGFAPIGRGHPLYDEALDALCDSGPGGSMDFSKEEKR